MQKSIKITLAAALFTALVGFAVPASACNGNGNCDSAPGHTKGGPARSLAPVSRLSQSATAPTGLCVGIDASRTLPRSITFRHCA